jgi:PAS domain S-box-containing protein
VAIYHLIVTRRLVAMASTLRGVTAEDLRALPDSQAQPVAAAPADEIDGLAASIALLRAVGHRALRDSDDQHAQLRSLMDGIPDLVWLKDPEGRYLACNPRFEKLYGCREAGMIGKDDFDFMDRETAELFRRHDRLAMEAGAPRTNEEWLTFLDGGYRGLFETIKTPVRMPDGRLVGVLGVARDITARKAAEDAVREERRVRETIMESIPGIVYAVDAAGQLIFWNRNFEQVTERSADELAGLSAALLFDGEHRQAVERRIRDVFVHGYAETEADISTKSGRARPYFFTGLRIDIGGRPVLVGTGIDISARRQAERELKQLNVELERRVSQRTADLRAAHDKLAETQFAMDSVGIGIAWTDVETGRFVYANRHMAEFLGYAEEEMLGLGVSDIDPAFPADDFRAHVAAVREAGHVQFETVHVTRARRRVPVEMSIYYHAGNGNAPPRLIAFISDIAKRKEAEQALLRAKEDAEAANQAKSAFLANMSHEIRTPMNAIIGLAYLLRRDSSEPVALDRLGKLAEAGNHLLQLIDDILDLSKIEAGRLELEKTDFSFAEILARCRGLVAQRADDKGLVLEVVDHGVPGVLHGDPTRLAQALLNLMSNAVKFTESGRIRVDADVLSRDARSVLLRLRVRDTGVGIAADKIGGLFQAFAQADTSTTRRFGGTGLGLAITQRLAEMMDGEIGVDSSPGGGSAFWFTARLALATQVPSLPVDNLRDVEAELRRRAAGLCILVVEDNPINQALARALLGVVGLRVETCASGVEALVQVARTHFDLVLMDLQMPDMDGLEATRRIRAGTHNPGVPVIAITASTVGAGTDVCEQAGMNDRLAKPFDPRRLYETLLRWLPAAEPPARTAPPSVRSGGPQAQELDRLESLLQAGEFESDAAYRLLRPTMRERFGAELAEFESALLAFEHDRALAALRRLRAAG